MAKVFQETAWILFQPVVVNVKASVKMQAVVLQTAPKNPLVKRKFVLIKWGLCNH